MLRRYLTIVAAFFLAAWSSGPSNLEFDADSKVGLIIFETEPTSKILVQGASYSLTIVEYSAETGKQKGLTGKTAIIDELGLNQNDRSYVVKKLNPGRYVFSSLSHENVMHACLNGGTVYFDVKPGGATFLGRIDPVPTLRQLRDRAMKRSSYDTRPGDNWVLDDPQLQIVTPDKLSGWEDGVSKALAADYPNVSVKAEAGTVTPTTYNPGNALLGPRVCIGFFAKSNKAS